MTAAFPLSWPDTMPRSKNREAGQFKTSLAAALKNVEDSLRRFGADSNRPVANVIISSNVTLGVNNPPDPGVAVWFTWDGEQICIPVDRYSKVEANLQAIHHVLEARRTELRHGTLALVRASFRGLQALPPPPHWSKVFGLPKGATLKDVEGAFKRLAMKAHPDHGGSEEAMAELNRARSRAQQELGA